MLILLSMDVTSVLFLVQFNNFALTAGFYWSYTLLLKLPVLMWSSNVYVCAFACMHVHLHARARETLCVLCVYAYIMYMHV